MRLHTIIFVGIFAMTLGAGHSQAQTKKRSRRQLAPVSFKTNQARGSSLIGTRQIRTAVVRGMKDYLREPKFSGSTTRGAWNRIDLKSLSLKDVTINTGRHDSLGYRLDRGEFPFTAHIKAKQGKPGEKKSITIQVKSIIDLRKNQPRFAGARVKTTPLLKAEDAAHLGDTSTAYWID